MLDASGIPPGAAGTAESIARRLSSYGAIHAFASANVIREPVSLDSDMPHVQAHDAICLDGWSPLHDSVAIPAPLSWRPDHVKAGKPDEHDKVIVPPASPRVQSPHGGPILE